MVTKTDDQTLYDKDFYLWIQETANLLKTRQLDQLDYENLIDEVESLGFMERANLRDNLRTHIPYLATRILINTNKSRLAEVLPHKGFRNHNLLINKSTPLYAAQKH